MPPPPRLRGRPSPGTATGRPARFACGRRRRESTPGELPSRTRHRSRRQARPRGAMPPPTRGVAPSVRLEPVAQAAQRQLDVDDQLLGLALELVEAAMQLREVGALRLIGFGEVLEARGPLHQALQARLAVAVHVRGLGAPEIEAAQEGADLAAAVL